MEVFKDILGYEGLYQVSNLGKVKSTERKAKHWRGGLLTVKSRIMKPFTSKCGYLIVSISKNSIDNKFLIHRLVSNAFIPNPYNKPQVNHINGIKTDNRVVNLEWNTRSENIKHADNSGLRNSKGENNSRSKLSEIDVFEIRKSDKPIIFLSKKYNVGRNCISKVLHKKTWKHI